MTLLSMSQDICDTIGLPRPTAIATGTDQISRQLLGIAKETVEDLTAPDWPIFAVPYTFQTAVNQDTYPLPSDYHHAIADTVYLATQYYPLRGSLTPSDWGRIKNALPSQIGRYKFRITQAAGSGPNFVMSPIPMTVETVVLEYRTQNRIIQSGGTHAITWTADTDMPIVPESLVKLGMKWRLKREKGLEYGDEFDDYVIQKQTYVSQALDIGSLSVAYRHLLDYPEIANGYVPEYGFGV
jgi:hypothetical protein